MNWRAWLGLAPKVAAEPKELTAKIEYKIRPSDSRVYAWIGSAWITFSDGELKHISEFGDTPEEVKAAIKSKAESYVEAYKKSNGKQTWTETK